MRTTGRKRWERERQSKTGRKKQHRTEEPDPPQRRPGKPTTIYENDPLRGDKRAHLIAKKIRQGWTPRKTAKFLGLPLDVVKETMERARGGGSDP